MPYGYSRVSADTCAPANSDHLRRSDNLLLLLRLILSVSHMSTIPIAGVEKERHIKVDSG